MKALRIALFGLLAVVAIVVAATAIFVATFDANRYKPEIEQWVHDRTGRTLVIEGEISFALFPEIGLKLGRTTLSDKDPKQPFVTINSSRASVALLPLLSGQVLIDGVAIDGLSARITRDKGGVFNFSDLIKTDAVSPTAKRNEQASVPDAGKTSGLKFDIGSFQLTDVTVDFDDQLNELDLKVSGLSLKTGQIAPQSSGKLELSTLLESKALTLKTNLVVKGNYTLNLAEQTVALESLSTELAGQWQDIESIEAIFNSNVSVDLKSGIYRLAAMDGQIKANVSKQAAQVVVQADQAKVTEHDVTVDSSSVKMTLGDQAQAIEVALKLAPFTFSNHQVNLKTLAADISVTAPALGSTPLTSNVKGNLLANTKSETITTELTGELDGSPLKVSVDARGFRAPAVTFDVTLDQLTLDRLGVTNASTRSDSTTGPDKLAAPQNMAASSEPVPIDLSGLKGHNIKGKLHIGKLVSERMVIDQLQANISLNEGQLSVAPHSAQLFGGQLAGSLSVNAHTNQYTLEETVTGVELESLLRGIGQDPKVTGQASMALDLSSSGNTLKALEQNMSGKTRVTLRDGTIKGIDIGAIINNARAMLGKAPTQQGTGSGETAFSELTATASIQKGIATNKDLSMKAPLFRLEGAGTINLPQSSLDYLARVAVVETSEGQGGKDLAALRGVTIPIKITGRFDSPRYTVNVASLAAELAKSQLGEKAREEVNKVLPGLGDALKGLFGR